MPLLTMFAESPVHAGTGAELGHVDLPIQRERATQVPTVHSSGVKGVVRDLARRSGVAQAVIADLFGSEPPTQPGGKGLEPGALAFSDARLVLFPCRTAGPIFAWVTSPYLLSRLRRDAKEADLQGVPNGVPSVPEDAALVTTKSAYPKNGVLIEEFQFTPQQSNLVDQWATFLQTLLPDGAEYQYWRDLLPKALAVVSDDNLRDFVTHGTEVITRVRLDPERKTVVEGALWTEEYLPQDTLLYCVVGVTVRRRSDETVLLGHFKTIIQAFPVAQFGGKETVGRGFVRLKIV